MQASGARITEESSHAERTSVHERTAEAIPTAADHAALSRGNPGCLTDGSTEVRYIRIRGASGLSEVSVCGVRETENAVSSVEIVRCAGEEGWMFAIPVAERSEDALVNIYDVSGRMIWSGHAESGSVLHWNGYTGDGTPVPNGVYLYQCSIGSDVSSGSFVVRRD